MQVSKDLIQGPAPGYAGCYSSYGLLAALFPFSYPIDHDMARRRFGHRQPEDSSFLNNVGTGLILLLSLIVVVPAAIGTVAQLLIGTATSPLLYTAYPLKLLGIDGLTNQLLVSWSVIFGVIILNILRKRSRNSLQTSPDGPDHKRDPAPIG